MHRLRFGVIDMDCETENLREPLDFLSSAPGEVDAEGKYAMREAPGGATRVLLRIVDHRRSVHIDLGRDDGKAERMYLEAIGASVMSRVKSLIAIKAPTGLRCCVVEPQTGDFPPPAAIRGGA